MDTKRTRAQELEDNHNGSAWEQFTARLEIDGYLEGESALRLHRAHRLSKLQNLLQLELKYHLRDNMEFSVLSRVMYDAVYDIYPDVFPQEVDEEYRSNFTADEAFGKILREVYVDIFLHSMDIRLGKQQVVWGEAIGLRITDIVNPQDFREFILDDFVDSRIPLWMAEIDFYLKSWSFEAIWIPIFESNRFALPGSDWEWTFNKPDTPPGTHRVFEEPEEPATTVENSEVGGRVAGFLAGWDISVYYLYAWDNSPTLHSSFDTQTSTRTFSPRYHRLHMFGSTFAKAIKTFVPRGEISYNMGKRYNTADRSDEDGVVKKHFLHYMVGTDYSVSEYLFNFQFIQKIIMDYEKGMYEDRIQNSISLWIQTKFLNETLRPEVLIIYGPNDEAWWIRPKIVYDLTDDVGITVGSDILEGAERSFIGQFDRNDRIFVEVKYSF